MKFKVVMSTYSKENFEKMLLQYFCGSKNELKDNGEIVTSDGKVLSLKWRVKNNRYQLIRRV